MKQCPCAPLPPRKSRKVCYSSIVTTSLKVDWSGKKVFAHYDVFKVDNEKNNYKITVVGYNGTSGDSLSYHNNIMFSTRDKDNDMWKTGSCSNDLTGGWWFNDCHNSNLQRYWLGSI